MGTEYVAVGFTILFTMATSLWLGRHMFHVFTGQRTCLDPVLVPIERLVLRLTGRSTSAATASIVSILFLLRVDPERYCSGRFGFAMIGLHSARCLLMSAPNPNAPILKRCFARCRRRHAPHSAAS
jgi:K+-transporting ATPase A subunit